MYRYKIVFMSEFDAKKREAPSDFLHDHLNLRLRQRPDRLAEKGDSKCYGRWSVRWHHRRRASWNELAKPSLRSRSTLRKGGRFSDPLESSQSTYRVTWPAAQGGETGVATSQ